MVHPAGQGVPATPPLQPAPNNPPPATGRVAALGRWAFDWALAHDVAHQPIDGQSFTQIHPECSRLIQAISDQVIKTLLIETKNSSFVHGGSQPLQAAIVELAEHIFIALGSQGGADQEAVGDEVLIERVLIKILKTVKEEFATDGGISTKRHFQNIADKLFRDAFPQGVNDTRLPKLLRDDWTSKIARFGVARAADIDLSWSGIKSIFADYLEQIYNAFTAHDGLKLEDERLPGANAFIDAIVLKVDTAIKNTTSVSLDIPIESDEAKAFVNNALARLMQGKFTNPEDARVVQEARTWLLDHVKTSVKAIYEVLFASSDDQSSRSRLNEFAENLIERARDILPQTYARVAQINDLTTSDLAERLDQILDPEFSSKIAKCSSMSQRALVNLLNELQDHNKMALYQGQLRDMLLEIEAAQELSSSEKKPVLDKARRLLQTIGADQIALGDAREKINKADPVAVLEAKKCLCTIESLHALELLLRDELKEDRIQPLLPDFLPADFVFAKLYGVMAPFVADIISQSIVIAKEGKNASDGIVKLKGGAKIEGWIDKALAWLWNDLETKALAGTLDFTKYELTDSLICHVLSPTTLAKIPGVKQYLSGQIKNVINIVLQDILNTQGVDDSEKALALCVNGVIIKGQQAVSLLMQVPEGEKTVEACKALALELNDALKAEELEPAVLCDTYDKLSLRKSSRQILEGVISQQRFNDLLPEFLKKSNFWQSGAEFLSDNVLKGLYSQAKHVQSASAAKFVLPEGLKPMLEQLNATILKALTFSENPVVHDEGSFTHIARELVNGPGVMNLVQSTLPKLIESAIAFHVHATETQSSEQQAAALVVGFATDIQNGFDRAAAAPIDVRAAILRETALKVVNRLLPEDLRKVLVPEKFAPVLIDQLLVGACCDYLQKAYDYSQVVTGLEKGDADVGGLQNYLVGQLKEYFEKIPEGEKTWTDKVALEIFASGSEKLMGFLLNFGAIGIVLKNAMGSSQGEGSQEQGGQVPLLTFLSPIIAKAIGIFDILSSSSPSKAKREQLNLVLAVTDKDVAAYGMATKQSADADTALFAYWMSARRALDGISDDKWNEANPLFTKDKAASMLMKLYETVHRTLDVLQKKQKSGQLEVAEHNGLTEFVDTYFVKNFKELLVELGNSPDALTKTLPAILDTLLKQCLGDKGDIGGLLDVLVERVVYAAMGKILTDQKPVTAKLCELVESYKKGDNEATAALLLKTALPQEVGATAIGKVIINEAAPKGIALLIEDIRKSQAQVLRKGQEAKAFVDSLDDGSMQKFVKETILDGLDSSLTGLANGEEPLSKAFPVYIDTLIKDILKDPALMPIVTEALHNVIYIVLQQVLTPKLGQTVQDRVLEVAADLIAIANADNPGESGAKWLKLLLPEGALKELLPEFLQKSVTHEKLIEWFFEPYVGQVFATTKAVAAENLKPIIGTNVPRAQNFAKKLLAGYAKPTAGPEGLLGFAGVVREIEKKLLETVGQGPDAQVAPQMQAYLDATVGQVTRSLESQGKLDPQFLSRALKLALPQLDAKTAKPDGMPSREDFSLKAAEELLKTLFPGGKKDLLVPEVVQDAIWKKITAGLQGVFTELTAADTRILWLTDRLIPLTSGDDTTIIARMQELKEVRGKKDKMGAQKLFKRCLVDMAVYQAGEAIKKETTPQPFKWLKGVIVKAVTYLVMRYSLSSRIYSFMAAEASNERLRRVIWALLTVKPEDNDKDEDLKKQLKAALHSTKIAPPVMQGIIASFVESTLANKNIIDLIA